MADPAATVLPADDAARLADFARACKAAARAVSLYPGSHPAIAASLDRLTALTSRLARAGPCRLEVVADRLMVNGAVAGKPDPAISELAALLHRHLVGALTLTAQADANSWRPFLLLLARPPDEVRADGGIARLWATAGGASLEIQEIDYAEVLREKESAAAAIEQIVAAALAGPQMRLDDSGMRLLLEIARDPARLTLLMKKIEDETAKAGGGTDRHAAAFLSLLCGLADWTGRHHPERLATVVGQLGQAAGRLSADGMLSLLAQRRSTESGTRTAQLARAVTEQMTDTTVSQFVAGSVISERGASERLAQAFQALVPDTDRQRRLLALAEAEVSASDLGHEEGFADLWQRVEGLLASYSDKTFVSDEYGRELSNAKVQAIDVERLSDDPPERVAAWLSTVNDAALRDLDAQLILDLLTIETDPLRWRDVAETALGHAEDLVRVDRLDAAYRLADAVVRESRSAPSRMEHATAALDRFARGSLMKLAAAHMRGASDEAYERFRALCHAIGLPVIVPLAEALTAERDARSRRRLRDILVGFGASGRDAVQRLMHAPNWEVRRTAAFLLREFGGVEGLRELIPLLADSEPLVQREAVQGLLLNGSDEACHILLDAVSSTSGRARESLLAELTNARDGRAVPLFRYLLRHMDRRKQPRLYLTSIEALGRPGDGDSVEPLKFALYEGDWTSPMDTRRLRSAAATALHRIGTPAALAVLQEAADRGPRGVRSAARDVLSVGS